MNADDQDDQDQQPDFRLLLSNSKGTSQALPSRDAKSAQDPEAILKEQYDAFFQVISEDRRLQEKTLSRAVYDPELGLFRLTVNKGNHFVSMGHALQGHIYLYPEEALYLVDRSSLLVEHNGVDMSLQQTWSLYLSRPQNNTRQWDSTRTMDRYLAYAYLKRLGYVVTRPGTYDLRPTGTKSQTTKAQESTAVTSQSSDAWSSSLLWRTLVETWRAGTRIVLTNLRRLFEPLSGLWDNRLDRPLVANNEQLTHEQILQRIRIIPSRRLVHAGEESEQDAERNSVKRDIWKHKVDFEVYKPAGAFKKRQPGNPDHRVIVVSAKTKLPTLEELSVMMEGLVEPAQAETSPTPSDSSSTKATDKGKKNKQPDWPKVLFAVVDGGQVSFMSMSNLQATL